MNAREAAAIVALVAAAYPQWPVTKETVAVYADSLSDLPASLVTEAVRSLIRTDDRWPTVATIRLRVAGDAGVLAPSAAEAWAEVTRGAVAVGRTRLPEFSHPTVESAVQAIGWYNLCATENLDTMRAQFTRIYEDGRRRHDSAMVGKDGAINRERDRRDLARRPAAALEPPSAGAS
jgi:hypothetical protein